MNIKVSPAIVVQASDINTRTSEPYHMRVEVDEENKQIRIPVFNEKDEIQLIVIDGVTPFMGHSKVDECCR